MWLQKFVRGCGPPRRGASQASGPSPGPHFPLPGRGEVWGAGYRSHREPGPGVKEEAPGVSGPAGARGGGYGPQVSPGPWDFGSIKDNWMLTGWGAGEGVLILEVWDVGALDSLLYSTLGTLL